MDTALIIDGRVMQVWRGHEPLAPVGGLLVRCRPGKAHCGMMWRDGMLLDPERTSAVPYGLHVVAQEIAVPIGSVQPAQAAGAVSQNVTVNIPLPAASVLPAYSVQQGAPPASSPLSGGVSIPVAITPPIAAGFPPAAYPSPSQAGTVYSERWSHAQEVLAETCQRAMDGQQASREILTPKAHAAGLDLEEYCAAILIERARVHLEILETA